MADKIRSRPTPSRGKELWSKGFAHLPVELTLEQKLRSVRTAPLFLFLLLTWALPAQESFLSWHTEVAPQTDRSLEITETITVAAEGREVKRGITRSLPLGRGVEVLSVTRDGRKEDYHTNRAGGQLTLYAGRRKVMLEPGTYRYRLRYRLQGMVARTDEVDELNLNLLGPDVSLPVDSLSATLLLPPGLTAVQYACYTGQSGDTDKNCTMSAPSDGQLDFRGVGTFGRGQVMTVAAGFPPGWFVASEAQPAVQEMADLNVLQREGSVFFLLLGLLAFLYYAYTSWRKYGVDPPTPRVGPVFTPPADHSPAAIGYLTSDFASDATACFTASIVALAGKGLLTIEPEEKKGFFSTSVVYHLRRRQSLGEFAPLPPEQEVLFRELFADGGEVVLEASYDTKFRKVATAHESSLIDQFTAFRNVGSNGKRVLPLLGILLVSLVPGILFLRTDTTGYAIPALVAFAVIGLGGLVAYALLIRQPTPEKVRLRAEIAALKEYLSLPENKRTRLLNAPPMSPEHYEDLLPYAIALGISTKWSDYFGDLLSTGAYRPGYVLGQGAFHPAVFSKDFSTAVTATATPPGSASGGGGSAGGGGGGGGAGGW